MQALGIDKLNLISQIGRLSKCLCVCVKQREWQKQISSRIPDAFLPLLKSIGFCRPSLSSPYCHIDQCHCSLFLPLNIPWMHRSPFFDLLLLLCCSSSSLTILFFIVFPLSSSPSPLFSFPLLQPLLYFLPLFSSVKEKSVCDEG